ncbi:MAG: LytR C-terminal domain-containing protein [Actinomycetota bacterium]
MAGDDDLWRERRGAHRPRGVARSGIVPWFFAAVVIAVIAVLGVKFLSNNEAVDPVASPSPTSTAKKASSTASKTASPKPSQTVDQKTPILVLNSTTVNGLAKRAATALESQGWAIKDTDNYLGDPLEGTTILYFSADQKVTAEALAKDLGGAVVQESSKVEVLTAVVGADYSPPN